MIDPADLRDVFDRAASLPPQDRAAFLAQACDDNAALRREVERLLAADARARSLLGSDSSRSDSPAPESWESRPSALTAGEKAGPF